MINTHNDMPSDLKKTAKSMMVGRKNNIKKHSKDDVIKLLVS